MVFTESRRTQQYLFDLLERTEFAGRVMVFNGTNNDPTSKLERQREARVLEGRRDEAWRTFDQASRDVDRPKDELLDEIGNRLEQSARLEPVFTLRWRLS